MHNTGIILTLAYPETIVRVSSEWLASHVYLFGIGKKNYIRAGHAALILIERSTGTLDYYDFGRYVTPEPTGRVRSKMTDHELDFKLKANIQNNTITNLNEILKFLSTHPELTHGEGTMLASVCEDIDYEKARNYIECFQDKGFVTYAAFGSNNSNCARFVTEVVIESATNNGIKKRLKRSKWFTPSTLGSVLVSDTQQHIYQVSETGEIDAFKSSKFKENSRFFLDNLKEHTPNFEGNLEPKTNSVYHEKAQWLPGIGGGAWFELHHLENCSHYRMKRISPEGAINVDGSYEISEPDFDYEKQYDFTPNSNCNVMYVKQLGKIFRFNFLKVYMPD